MEISLNSRLLPLVVHDLLTPLNVIGLTLRMIEDGTPKVSPDLADDLRMIRENAFLIERMLKYVADYYRLNHESPKLSPAPFDPRRFVAEVVEGLSSRSPGKGAPIRVEVLADCPAEVELDPQQARTAFQNVLVNALAAAEGVPVRVTLSGGPGGGDGWMIAVRVDRPPSSDVQPSDLKSNIFKRLIGTADERLGMELAIVARVTELFGGEARLEVAEGRDSTIILNWPIRPPQA